MKEDLKNDNILKPKLKLGKKVIAFKSRPGSKDQSNYRNTQIGVAYLNAHTLLVRFLYAYNYHNNIYFALNAGDILVMRGDIYHTGAANSTKRLQNTINMLIGLIANFLLYSVHDTNRKGKV